MDVLLYSHLVHKMFKFGVVPVASGNDIAIRVPCLAPQSMNILSVDLADIHGNGRDMRDDVLGDGWGVSLWDFRDELKVIIICRVIISGLFKQDVISGVGLEGSVSG